MFGANVGTSSYAGPQLQNFVAGDTIDLKSFGSAGVTLNYNASTGVLQVANGSSPACELGFPELQPGQRNLPCRYRRGNRDLDNS